MASVERRLRDGKVTYLARWRDDSGQQRSKSFTRKGEAERWAAAMVTSLARGQYIDPRAGRVRVQEYAERWRQVQDHRDTTAALYERVLRLHVYPALGSRPVSSIRHTDARAFVTGLSRRLAPNTARQVHAIVRTIFRAAVSDRLIAESPFVGIRLPAVDRQQVQPLTVAQVQQLVAAAPALLRGLIVFAAATGLRSGELLGLTVDRVDFLRREVRVDRQLVYLPGSAPYLSAPKTKKSVRTVPVPTFALDALAAHLATFPPDEDGFVFQSDKGGPVLRTTLHGRWRQTLRRAGLDLGLHFHHLRHHYASVLIDGGESVKVVQERMGHASPEETLKVYAHLMPASEQRTRSVVETAWASVEPVCNNEAL